MHSSFDIDLAFDVTGFAGIRLVVTFDVLAGGGGNSLMECHSTTE
jgi:hypothetical protein